MRFLPFLLVCGCISSAIDPEGPGRDATTKAEQDFGKPPPPADAAPAFDVLPPSEDAAVDAEAPDTPEADSGANSNLPFVQGPEPASFDCRAETIPERRSPVAFDCMHDPTCRDHMVAGHRGVGGSIGTIAPENSLAAIRAAIVMGVDVVELDVRHSADEGLVLMHDESVDRTTDGAGEVDALSLARLQQLALKPPPHPRVEGEFGCERVPTLAQAFELSRGRVLIDLDMKTRRFDLVVEAIQAAGVIDEVYLNTGSVDETLQALELEPALRVMIRVDDGAEYAAAMERFDRAPEVVEVPASQVGALAPEIRAAGQTVFTNAFIEDAIAAVRGPETYDALFEAGADVVMTEFPPLVLESLERQP